jgi:hypothetical protein
MPNMSAVATGSLPTIPLASVPAAVAAEVEEIFASCLASPGEFIKVDFSDEDEPEMAKVVWETAARSYARQRSDVQGATPAGALKWRQRGGRRVNTATQLGVSLLLDDSE